MNLNEFIKFCEDQYEKYDHLSTEAIKKGNHKNELWFSARMWAYKEVLDKAFKCGLTDKAIEHEMKPIEVEIDE